MLTNTLQVYNVNLREEIELKPVLTENSFPVKDIFQIFIIFSLQNFYFDIFLQSV